MVRTVYFQFLCHSKLICRIYEEQLDSERGERLFEVQKYETLAWGKIMGAGGRTKGATFPVKKGTWCVQSPSQHQSDIHAD